MNILIKISACIRIRLSLKPGFHKSSGAAGSVITIITVITLFPKSLSV